MAPAMNSKAHLFHTVLCDGSSWASLSCSVKCRKETVAALDPGETQASSQPAEISPVDVPEGTKSLWHAFAWRALAAAPPPPNNSETDTVRTYILSHRCVVHWPAALMSASFFAILNTWLVPPSGLVLYMCFPAVVGAMHETVGKEKRSCIT